MNRRLPFIGDRNRALRLILAVVFWMRLCAHAAQYTVIPLAELEKKYASVPLPEIETTAKAGDVYAAHFLGHCYADGFRVTKDPNQALAWYKRGMDGGYLPSANNIGVLYAHGDLGMNTAQAISYYTIAAEGGFDIAQVNLGKAYRAGKDVAQNPEHALHWFHKAAEQHSTDAMVQLYICYWDGLGVASDHTNAMEWLLKAGNAGNTNAQRILVDRYNTLEFQGEGLNSHTAGPNWGQVFHWSRILATNNSPYGQYQLGLCYIQGKGVEKDEARGLELTRAAADRGLEAAMSQLASLYAQGIGSPRSELETPFNLLRRAKSWEELQDRYECGIGTQRDIFAAAECYCELTLQYPNRPDLFYLGDKIEFSANRKTMWADQRPSNDVRRALSSLLKAAKGEGKSAAEIGDHYSQGLDAPKSLSRAWAWCSVATKWKFAGGQNKIKELEARMTTEELKEGEKERTRLENQLQRIAASL